MSAKTQNYVLSPFDLACFSAFTFSNSARQRAALSKLLDEWTEATHDSAPADITKDSFDRETGKSLLPRVKGRAPTPRGTPAGGDRDAIHTNAPGPR